MTQAFNLSQLANNLNTSGQLDATDGLTGAVPVANGGTGQSSLTANAVILGNGTSGVQAVAPSTSGNILTSNGTTWVSQAPSGGGVTSFNGNTGALTGYQIVATGTFSSATTISIGSLPSGYSTFKIIFNSNISATTGGGSINIKFSTNGGSSYATSGYGWAYPSSVTDLSQSDMVFIGEVGLSGAGGYANMNFDLMQPTNGTIARIHGLSMSYYPSVTDARIYHVMGFYNSTTYINGIQFFRFGGSKTFTGNYIILGSK